MKVEMGLYRKISLPDPQIDDFCLKIGGKTPFMGLSERTHTSDPRYGEREGLGKEISLVVPTGSINWD